MGNSWFRDLAKDLIKSFKKQKPKTYLLGFLYDSDLDKQSEIIYLTFQLYYKDDSNPFAQLMPQLVRHCVIEGPYPDATIDEAKYLRIKETAQKLIKKAKEDGQDLSKFVESEYFNKCVNDSAKDIEKKMLENNDKLYYILVSTDDAEYQAELEKMYLPENQIQIKDQKISIVLEVFDAV